MKTAIVFVKLHGATPSLAHGLVNRFVQSECMQCDCGEEFGFYSIRQGHHKLPASPAEHG